MGPLRPNRPPACAASPPRYHSAAGVQRRRLYPKQDLGQLRRLCALAAQRGPEDVPDPPPPPDPRTRPNLVLYSVNLKGSKKRFEALQTFAQYPEKHGRGEEPPDIVLIQDPPPSILFSGHYARGYYIHAWAEKKPKRYRAANISDNVDEKERLAQLDKFQKEHEFVRVAFMVRNTIPREDINIIRHGNCNDLLVRTLKLTTECGTFQFHNAYNRLKRIDLGELMSTCTTSLCDFLCGDLNCHSRLWCDDDVNEDTEGRTVARGILAANMCSKMPRGRITYSQGCEESGKNLSSIDVVFVKDHNKERVKFCDVIEVPGFETDHRVIKIKLDITPNRVGEGRHLFDEENRNDYRRCLTEATSRLRKPARRRVFVTKEQVANFAKDICAAIMEATNSSMERSQPSTPPEIRPQSWQKKRIDLARRALEARAGDADKRWEEHWAASESLLNTLVIKERRSWYYRRIESTTKRCRHRVYNWVRIAKRRSTPPDPPQAPEFVDQRGRMPKMVSDHDEKGWLYTRTKWRNSTRCSEALFAERLQCPELPVNRRLLPRVPEDLDMLRPSEIDGILKDLKSHRTPGRSGITPEALNWGRDILEGLLEELFGACLRLRCHPDEFKVTITKAILKDGKDPCNPLSYRPIALLCCLGKVLDKIIANRYKVLAQENKSLIPNLQFGGPGKDTTSALLHLTNWVYSGWSTKVPMGDSFSPPDETPLADGRSTDFSLDNLLPGKRRRGRRHHPHYETTVMSLDVTQAYDNVNRTKLLSRLVELGIPDWLIEMTWSFLSNRRSSIDINGVKTKEDYWINTGIPQGSPLSPILFLLFAAPVFEQLPSVIVSYRARVSVFAYVDDIYLLVTSPSYGANCKALTELHKTLMCWAKEEEVDFGPSKYTVMHFRKPRTPGSTICTELPDIPELRAAELIDVLVTPDLFSRKCKKNQEETAQVPDADILLPPRDREEISAKDNDTKDNHAAEDNHKTKGNRKTKGKNKTRAQKRSARKVDDDAGVPEPKQHKHSLRILGVWVDPQLNWEEHVAQIESKVNKTLKYFRSISGPTKGPSIHRMRDLYITKLLPMITYACAAWFIYSPDPTVKPKWRFRKFLIKRLHSLQKRCFRVCSAAFSNRRRMETWKVLFIENLEVVLHRQSLLYRARQLCNADALWTEAVYGMDRVRRGVFHITPKQSQRSHHPLVALEDEAKRFLANARKYTHLFPGRCHPDEWRKAVNEYARERSDHFSQKLWRDHLAGVKDDGVHVPARDGEWGKENLAAFEGLGRSQSTMLLHIKTGAIALNAYMFLLGLSDSPKCGCGEEEQDARHLFLDCSLLNRERDQLFLELGHDDYDRMLSRTPDTKIMTDWAIKHFGIPQFATARKKLLRSELLARNPPCPSHPQGLPHPQGTQPPQNPQPHRNLQHSQRYHHPQPFPNLQYPRRRMSRRK